MPLRFESREHSSATLAAISSVDSATILPRSWMTRHKFSHPQRLPAPRKKPAFEDRENMAAVQTFETAQTEFAQYLGDQVRIMRVQVPAKTDLNHYFEIMNNRGEQLEKQEVLKARLMDRFNDIADETERRRGQHCLQVVWTLVPTWSVTCKQDSRPRSAAGSLLNGEKGGDRSWISERCAMQSSVRRRVCPYGLTGAGSMRSSKKPARRFKPRAGTGTKHPSASAPSSISPNFLLHVLRVQIGRKISLDDKRLIDTFTTHLLAPQDAVPSIQEFTVRLLRCKYLYDRYVIKREVFREKERWSLKRFKVGTDGSKDQGYYVHTFGDEEEDENKGEQRRVMMLLAALHVSAPTAVKYWLNATLEWLFRETEPIRSGRYTEQLESVARAFVFDDSSLQTRLWVTTRSFTITTQNAGRPEATFLWMSWRGGYRLAKLKTTWFSTIWIISCGGRRVRG